MERSLSLFEELGWTFIEQRLAENIAYLESSLADIDGIEFLTPRDPEMRAGILTFRHDDIAGSELHRTLMNAKVICSPRAGGVRLSPHFYTTQDALENAIRLIRQSIQTVNKKR